MKLSETQFEAICISTVLSPFIYLSLAWKGSAEATKNSHNGLYVMIGLVICSYVLPTILNYFDKQNHVTHSMMANGRVLKLVWVLFGVGTGFICFYGILSGKDKFDTIFGVNILLCIFMVITGNYQSRVKPNSAYNALFIRDYSEKVQARANRYQGRTMIFSGILLATALLIIPRVELLDITLLISFVSIITPFGAQYYAIYKTPSAERKRI